MNFLPRLLAANRAFLGQVKRAYIRADRDKVDGLEPATVRVNLLYNQKLRAFSVDQHTLNLCGKCSKYACLLPAPKKRDFRRNIQGRKISHRLSIFLLLILLISPAQAKEKSLGSFGAWQAYSDSEGGQTVCYMVTTKLTKSMSPKKRGQPYLMITHRPIEASTDTISYGAGMLVNTKRGVKLRVGKNAFDLFAVRDTAWARDALTDHKIAAALQNTAAAQALAQPAKKGPAINDVFDLAGASAAYHAIGRACGLEKAPARLARPVKAGAGKKSDKSQPTAR